MKRNLIIVLVTSYGVLCLPCETLQAQTRMIVGGNALDANKQVGSGGINFAAPPPPINRANSLMTGNVGGGGAFRGFSPIRDSSQFYTNLPTAGLSSFRADGVSVADLMAGQSNYAPRLYYDQSRTMVNVGGMQQGLNRPGSSMARDAYAAPRENIQTVIRDPVTFEQINNRRATGLGMAIEPGIQRSLNTFSPGMQQMNQRLLSSPLFANTSAVPLSQVGSTSGQSGYSLVNRESGGNPMEVQTPANAGEPQSPLNRLISPEAQVDERLDFRVNAGYDNQMMPPQQGPANPALLQTGGPMNATGMPQAPLDMNTTPEWIGQDRFRDMAAIARVINQQYLGQAESPGMPGSADASTIDRYAGWVREYMSKPMTSFAGTAPTKLNEFLAGAENHMRAGRYYSAVKQYELAATIDPASPLPMLGRAQGLMAAGEYMSAVNVLLKAIDRFPDLAYFNLDLKSFITDPRDIDRRRADLERILEKNDDYRLRFLLGFMEYYSGFSLPGLDNLLKAAYKAPENSPIARFPKMLKQGLSAPLTPPATQPATQPNA